jgi:hypothetical protein
MKIIKAAPAMASTGISMAADTEVDDGEKVMLDESQSRHRLSDGNVRLLLSLEVDGDDSLQFQTSMRQQWCEKGYVEVEMVEKFRIKACFGGKCRIQRG